MSVPRTRTSTTKPRTVRVNPAVPAPKIIVTPAPSPEPEPQPLLRVWVAGTPASGNHMYINRQKATGRLKRSKVLTPAAATWLEAVAVATRPWSTTFVDQPAPNLAVSCIFLGARADVDNLLKLTLDGLKVGLMVDDRYVTKVCAEKQPLPVRGERGAWIAVTCLPPVAKARRARNQRTA